MGNVQKETRYINTLCGVVMASFLDNDTKNELLQFLRGLEIVLFSDTINEGDA